MNFKSLALTLILAQTLIGQANASNRMDSDALFSGENSGETFLGLMGVVEIAAGGAALMTPEEMKKAENTLKKVKEEVKKAQHALDELNSGFANEMQRRTAVDALLSDPKSYRRGSPTGGIADLTADQAERLERMRSTPLVTAEARRLAGERLLAARRIALIRESQKLGYVHKDMRVLRRGGALILIPAGAAQVYIWLASEPNPRLSDASDYVSEFIEK